MSSSHKASCSSRSSSRPRRSTLCSSNTSRSRRHSSQYCSSNSSSRSSHCLPNYTLHSRQHSMRSR